MDSGSDRVKQDEGDKHPTYELPLKIIYPSSMQYLSCVSFVDWPRVLLHNVSHTCSANSVWKDMSLMLEEYTFSSSICID